MSGRRFVAMMVGNTSRRPRSACIFLEAVPGSQGGISGLGVSRLMLRQLLSQAKRISFLPSILSFSFFPFQDICSVLGYVSICTCPVLNRHCMIYKTYARVPLFQQSSPFMFSVGLYLYRLVSVGNTDLNMN